MIEPWAAPLLIVIAVLVFYAIPLASTNAGIHWDAGDVQYPLQKYFAERLRSGNLPYWTPYLFSGYPILANPEMQAWYLPNWPFLLLGMKASMVEFELALHALIACLGAYLFFRLTVGRTAGAVLGAFAYGLSGFFAGHSSHLPVFAAAAWFPWLLWCYRRAADSRSLAGVASGGLVGGAMVLAGHLPAAFFAFAGLAWYMLTDIRWNRRNWRHYATVFGGIVILSLGISCIQLLPAMELIHRSRLATDYSRETLQPRAVMTLLVPNATGAISTKDRGLITNQYLYAGLLLLPLALIGARNRRAALAALALIVPAVWYMLGPAGLFYRLGAAIPALQQLAPPNIAWFLAAFGLAWLAAAGCHRLFRDLPFLGILCAALFFADLWYWNLYRNPLAYARTATDPLPNEETVHLLTAPQLPLTRFDSASPIAGAGPLLFPLEMKFETTTGFPMLEIATYHEYVAAMTRNPRLRDGLNVARYMNSTGQIESNSNFLARAYFPRSVVATASERASREALVGLNPAVQSTVMAPDYALHQDPRAEPFIVGFDEQSYAVHYLAHVPSLLKLSVPWYPGWNAILAARKLPVLRVDHALIGVVVPPGEGMVEFRFRSKYFPLGLLIGVVTLFVMAGMTWGKALWARLTMRFV